MASSLLYYTHILKLDLWSLLSTVTLRSFCHIQKPTFPSYWRDQDKVISISTYLQNFPWRASPTSIILIDNYFVIKESSHRAEELKTLGWSPDDISRYIELWDYRQRWGAINLEREDRQFLRKAEAALPVLTNAKASIKKPLNEKSYYCRLRFFIEAMDQAERDLGIAKGSRGIWPIMLEEELRILDYYQPVLGLPDTLKAKQIDLLREEIVEKSLNEASYDLNVLAFDFKAPLEALKEKESSRWRPLRETANTDDQRYPVLEKSLLGDFRKIVRSHLVPLIPRLLPSLSDTDKPELPDDWRRD